MNSAGRGSTGHPPRWAWWVIGIVIPLLGTATTFLVTSQKDRNTAASAASHAPAPESPPADHESSPPASDTASQTPAPSSSPPESANPAPTGPREVSLTTMDQVGGSSFVAASATLDGKAYEDSLVSTPRCPSRDDVKFNLGKEWKKFSLVAGIDDDSVTDSAEIIITADDETLYRTTLTLGNPKELALDVSDRIRLTIHYSEGGGCSGKDTWIVLGNAKLSD